MYGALTGGVLEQLHEMGVVGLLGQVHGRQPAAVLGQDVRVVLQQETGDGQVPVLRGDVQGGLQDTEHGLERSAPTIPNRWCMDSGRPGVQGSPRSFYYRGQGFNFRIM